MMQVKTTEDLEKALKRVGDILREKSDNENDANNKIQELQSKLVSKVTPLNKELDFLTNSIKAFADENKTTLMAFSKTYECATGSIYYRLTKDSVATKLTEKFLKSVFENNALGKIVETFIKKMSKYYLKVKLELDKTAILDNQEDAKELIGVEIKKASERFYIKTATVDTELEVAEAA